MPMNRTASHFPVDYAIMTKIRVVILGVGCFLWVFDATRLNIVDDFSNNFFTFNTNNIKSDSEHLKIDSFLYKDIITTRVYGLEIPQKYFFKRIIFKVSSNAAPSSFSEVKLCGRIGNICTGFIELNKLPILSQRAGVECIESGANNIVITEKACLPFLNPKIKNDSPKENSCNREEEPIIGITNAQNQKFCPLDLIILPDSLTVSNWDSVCLLK